MPLCPLDSVLQCRVAYNKYGGFCVPSWARLGVAQKILSGDVYEPKTIEFLVSNNDGGDIVHAGTFFGDFLPALSRSLMTGAKVWAFEPNRENYRCSVITIYINDLKNVELINAGLGERQDRLRMMTSKNRGKPMGGGSRMVREGDMVSSEQTEIVQIVALDEVVPLDRRVSIIHLDVEGYETEALSGSLKTIRRCLPIILLETLPENKWLTKNILCYGYKKNGVVHGNTIYVHEV